MMESGSSRIKVIIMIIIVAYFCGAARTIGIKLRTVKIIATAARHKVEISSYTATRVNTSQTVMFVRQAVNLNHRENRTISHTFEANAVPVSRHLHCHRQF
jgi:hypothetical protein